MTRMCSNKDCPLYLVIQVPASRGESKDKCRLCKKRFRRTPKK